MNQYTRGAELLGQAYQFLFTLMFSWAYRESVAVQPERASDWDWLQAGIRLSWVAIAQVFPWKSDI
jgi:hypothetical protein